MFRHEDAPVCSTTLCRSKMCQFKHDNVVQTNSDNKVEHEQNYVDKTAKVYPCNIHGLVWKTEADLGLHMMSTHSSSNRCNTEYSVDTIDIDISNESEKTDKICEECTSNCGEDIVHTYDITRTCSQCDFKTKCEDAWDEHWTSAPGHDRANWTPFE